MAIEVETVRGYRGVGEFIELPYRLHAGTRWVPPLRLERRVFLSRKLNAYFSHGEAEYFVARRGGRVVGRVSAQVDFEYNRFHGSRTGNFGFLEFEDDAEVLDALLASAEGWLRSRGCTEMRGPMDFSLNDESGVLIEGYEIDPLIRQPWHPPYYKERMEAAAGLEKAMDLLSWDLSVDDREHLNPIIPKLAERCKTKHGIHVRKMSRRSLRADLDRFADVYNSAWSENWGFVPYSKKDLDAYALDLQLVYSPEWFMVAEREGETVAAAITVMDANTFLRKMKGRLLPLGWWHFLRRNRTTDRLRVGFLGVKPEFQHTGVAALLYMEHFEAARNSRLKSGEAGWILEVNKNMNSGLEAMNGRIVKRYRVYERKLS